MPSQTLLGHLAGRFASHEEVVASEALNFILGSSPRARQALLSIPIGGGAEMPSDLTFHREATSDAAPGRVDVVGVDDGRVERLLIEVKFWAGLTPNQPANYLKRLKAGGCLLFVAPPERISGLWPRLVELADPDNPEEWAGSAAIGDTRAARSSDGRWMMITSWDEVMDRIGQQETDPGTIGDLAQLRGLCKVLDDDPFPPLSTPETLDQGFPRRYMQYLNLLEKHILPAGDAAGILVPKGLASRRRLGEWGHYRIIAGYPAWVSVDVTRWARNEPTPYWLSVKDQWDGGGHERALQLLSVIKRAGRSIVEDVPAGADEVASVPLFCPIAAERDAVVESIVQQLQAGSDALARGGPGPYSDGAPAADAIEEGADS